MNRREFVSATAALAAAGACGAQPFKASQAQPGHVPLPQESFPEGVLRDDSYVEPSPIAGYRNAPASSVEAFQDLKFGIRIHWGLYSIWHRGAESWPFLNMSMGDRQSYNSLYKTWNPARFDADVWTDAFKASGMKMFAFTTKHHEGFSMFDTATRVKNRANWLGAGGPTIESCDLAYSIMETPFKRDVVKELCAAAHKRDLKIDLYFSHPDWYDADFRPYVQHPLQVPSSSRLQTAKDIERTRHFFGDAPVIVPDPTDAEVARMMARHRAQLVELLTNYGRIDMMCLDMYLGPRVWPELRKTILKLREIQPDIMLRNRGIGNYGDYFTPERVVPGSKEASSKPWFSIYPLGTDFSYEPDAEKHKGTEWVVHSLVDTVAKGGGLMIGVGPSAHGEFHPEALRQMKAAGKWLQVNGESIYATRPREGLLWSEGESVRFTRSKDNRFVYAIVLTWPGRKVTLTSVRPRRGSKVAMLGWGAAVQWKSEAQGTVFTMPETMQQASNRPCEHAWCLKIEAEQG